MVGLQKGPGLFGLRGARHRLGALYVRDGMSESEAAAKAFNDLVGNRYDFRDTYRVPKNPQINPDDVQRGVYQATQSCSGSATATPQARSAGCRWLQNDLGVSDNEADMRRASPATGRFVTSPRNDGLNILVGNKFVKNQDGTPVLLHWDQLQKLGGTKEAAQADANRAVVGTEQTP